MSKTKLFLIFIIFLFMTIIIFNKQLLVFYSSLFIETKYQKSSDAVILLRGDANSIALKAKELSSKSYFIIDGKQISEKYSDMFLSEAQKKKIILNENGTHAKILNSFLAVNRFDEALEVIKILKENNLSHILLVGGTISSRRTKLVFEYMLNRSGFSNVKVDYACATTIPVDWYKKESYLIAHLLEPFMWLFYLGMLNRY